MTTKHTPGPWIGAGPSFGDPLPRYTTEIITESEDENGEVRSICELPVAHHDDENEANARLIAAAPELLSALAGMLAIVNDSQSVAGYHLNGELEPWDGFPEIERARAAIAKATGEQA